MDRVRLAFVRSPTAGKVLVAWAAVAIAASGAYGQSYDPLDVNVAREKRVKERGKKVFYTRTFNLNDLAQYAPEQQVSGTIRIWGLNYITDGYLASYWEKGFRKYQPNVRFEYYTPTALVAIPGLYTHLADLGASRKITFDELLAFQRIFKYHPLEITMVTGSFDVTGHANALGVFVHKDNPISRLTLKQLDGILGAERTGGWKGLTWHPEVARGPEGNIRTWGQLGLTGEWRDKAINVYGRNLRYHEQLDIERKVFQGGNKWNERLREYANSVKADGSMAVSAEGTMADLSKDRYGIAYSNMRYPTLETKVIALAEKEGGPYFEPTIESVQNRTYPLFAEEYFYVNREPGKPLEPKVKEYLRYVLSHEGQEDVERDGKFLPLTAEVAREQLKKLK
jgi:phosphate transport system substrate-binding protein